MVSFKLNIQVDYRDTYMNRIWKELLPRTHIPSERERALVSSCNSKKTCKCLLSDCNLFFQSAVPLMTIENTTADRQFSEATNEISTNL